MAKLHIGHAAARRRRGQKAFSDGFTDGLTAPALLFAGLFETPLQTRRGSIEGSWSRVGQYLRFGVAEHRIASERASHKR